jgi:hypothetical protein
MAVFTVQPGKLRNGELRTLAGDGQKAQMAIAQNKVIELAEEKIADTVGFQPFTAIIGLNGGIGMNLQLPEGEIAKLPAHMQQALPDVQRQGDAFNRKLAAIIQAGLNIADIKRRAKVCQLATIFEASTGTPAIAEIFPAPADASCSTAAERDADRSPAARRQQSMLPR